MPDKHRDRQYCHNLLLQYTQNSSLLKHAYAVEACVRAYAEKFGADAEYWGNTALLHDFDYEMYPSLEDHPFKGNEILESIGFEQDFRDTILAHAEHTGVKRDTLHKKVLYACDELAGFITAVAYVRPTKSVMEVEVSSVRKKMKDKAFAKNVSREDIIRGAAELGIELDQHINYCIEAMRASKEELGL
ncbi:MAG: HDIG domain-containing protein [Ignavibacteriales bacterium]|nr:HDIG domain-containing protein [Ignavibacteriales bacterium]MCF8316114.1 HDIG domain-containing protein [Ignavibacteriales bacterium]MCF8436616.1 HDIG domain-containing protein [Ignavibacteriales bacterium]